MKYNQITIIILLLLRINSYGQIDVTDKIFPKIIFEEIVVKDSVGKILRESEIYNLLHQVDSIMSSIEIHEEFVENLYVLNGLLVVVTEYEIDTIRRTNSETELVKILRDDLGAYLGREKIFNLDSKFIINLQNPIKYNGSKNDLRLLTKGKEYWTIRKIKTRNKKIFIDECHEKYRLYFPDKTNYSQSYGISQECHATINLKKIKKRNYMEYWGKELNHRINSNHGIWKTNKNKLYITNEKENQIKIIPYQIKRKKLILELEQDYLIEFKKEGSQ